jgi:hypothetical protein
MTAIWLRLEAALWNIRGIRKFAAHLHCTERSAVQVFALMNL